MLKTAFKYLVDLGIKPEERFVHQGDRLFTVNAEGGVKEIEENVRVFLAQDVLKINTLTGLINYIKSNLERESKQLFLHVVDEETVELKGLLEADGSRETLVKASAIVPNIYYDTFLSAEDFIISLQSKFVPNNDREILLKVMGNATDENVKSIGDDGVSQSVAIRQGVASKAEVKVPNPVVLAPFRTFLEVEQPESQFIFRMKDGPRGAIFEADGGAWRNQAIKNI